MTGASPTVEAGQSIVGILESVDIQLIVGEVSSIAARPVSVQAASRVAGFDEHPRIAVNREDGASSEHEEVARAVDVEVREVAISNERKVALIGVEEHNTEVFLRLFDGFNVAAHVSVPFI
jgi:hypothetical protein